ncbi:phosphotransferase family protein [Streptomyces coryli]|uniref:phosphotransferase family protein n=1 Tax=Streptomyces coryli TaxID=1128680 RepID=UPI0030B87BB8
MEVPLTAAVRAATGVVGTAERLYGGEESAAWRVGDRVVRIGAYEKDLAEVEWCHAVAVAARAGGCAEAVAAARLLARLHRALADVRLPARPRPSFLETGLRGEVAYEDPRLRDPELDAWLAEFSGRARLRHPLHGDFYHGNLLADRAEPRRLVAVLDWDEALVAPPEVEVGSAALEFANETGESFADARRFVDAYLEAGGTAGAVSDEELAQLMRHRLRREGAYFAQAVARGVEHDAEDLDYHRRRMEAFARLRP